MDCFYEAAGEDSIQITLSQKQSLMNWPNHLWKMCVRGCLLAIARLNKAAIT